MGFLPLESLKSNLCVSFLVLQHASKIVHRDFKPANLGFDVRGDIKVFDFGLARELTEHEKGDDGTYGFSHLTGSLRYMAPEVALGKRYNAAADVYSFSIVLWEILALDKPYAGFGAEDDFVARVFHKGDRPPIKPSFPSGCKSAVVGGWNPTFQDRLPMFDITKMLRTELVALRNGDDEGKSGENVAMNPKFLSQ